MSKSLFQLMQTFWESASLIGPLGFLCDEIISVDTDFSTSPHSCPGKGTFPSVPVLLLLGTELTEMTNHWPLSFCLCLSVFSFPLSLAPPQIEPTHQDRDLSSLDEGARLSVAFHRIFSWISDLLR